jgi:hypothetical protein
MVGKIDGATGGAYRPRADVGLHSGAPPADVQKGRRREQHHGDAILTFIG